MLKNIKRRFPERSAAEVHWVMEAVLERMAPSRNITFLQRGMMQTLKNWRDTGVAPSTDEVIWHRYVDPR